MTGPYIDTSSTYSLSVSYAEGVEVLYAYTEIDPFSEYTVVSYTYSDNAKAQIPVKGRMAAATQLIMNNMPEWMNARKKHDSVAQKLVHA